MSIKWKNNKNLKPAVILDRISSIRTMGVGNRISFSAIEIHDAMPALNSMLLFPPEANNIQQSILVWKALASITGKLTPDAFLKGINDVLSTELSTQDQNFHVLTSISIETGQAPPKTYIDGCIIRFIKTGYPKNYSDRESAIRRVNPPVENNPANYCRVVIEVTAKSPHGAMTKALRALDLQRSIWCLMCNSQMQIIGEEWSPINKIRLGSIHTVHNLDGSLASEQIWFEPNFAACSTHHFDEIKLLTKRSKKALASLGRCSYGELLSDSLLRYVRALDERDQNTAFLRLWGAIEALASQGSTNSDALVRRCAFLFRDMDYHQQILQHLREYRNQSVHAGDQSSNAKTQCYQLQYYFFHLIWFHIGSTHFFNNLSEVSTFLDLGQEKNSLIRKKQLITKAIRFIS